MIYKLLNATTSQATTPEFTPAGQGVITLVCNNLQGSEAVTLQIYDSANDIWSNAVNGGSPYQITVGNNFMVISVDVAKYRFVKSATTTAVALNIYSLLMLNGLIQV